MDARGSRTFSGDRLRAARTGAGIGQREAAARLQVSRTTLFNAETGLSTPGGDLLARLADLYGVPIDSLFTHAPEPDTGSDGHGKSHEPDTAAVGGSAGLAHHGG